MDEELRKILLSPDFTAGVIRDMHAEEERWQGEARRMLERHYPEHVAHNPGELVEGEWEYFDAMFVSYEIICGCGERLVVSREMVEGRW